MEILLIIFFQEDDTLNGGSDDNPELRQINLLRQVKAEKEQDSPAYKHVGYKVLLFLSAMFFYLLFFYTAIVHIKLLLINNIFPTVYSVW